MNPPPPEQDKEFEELMRTWQEPVLRYLLKRLNDRDTAEDLAQDVLLRIHKSRHTFDPEKGEFGSWTMRIAHNVFVSYLQKRGARPAESSYDETPEGATSSASGETPTGEQYELKMLVAEIKAAIGCLPEPEKTVVYNKEIRNMKLADTADELGVSVRTVSRKLLSAYDLLRDELRRRGITPEEFAGI